MAHKKVTQPEEGLTEKKPRKKTVYPKRKVRVAKETIEKLKKSTPNEEVVLRFRHSINNRYYGPGKVRVNVGVAATLREQESRATEEIDRFRGTRTVMMLPGGRAVQVREGSLDTYLGSAPPYTVLR